MKSRKRSEGNLKRYVYYELFNNEDKPEFSNQRFYPCKKDIRNHFRLAIAERKFAKKDQDHLKLLVDEWKASVDSQDKFLFTPYVAAKKFGNEAGGSKACEEESTGSDASVTADTSFQVFGLTGLKREPSLPASKANALNH